MRKQNDRIGSGLEASIVVILAAIVLSAIGFVALHVLFRINLKTSIWASLPAGIIAVLAIGFWKYLTAPKIVRKIRRIKRVLKRKLSDRRLGKITLDHIGVPDIDPNQLLLCIVVETDGIADSLKRDPTLETEVRSLFVAGGYPLEASREIGISVVSQETLNREYDGSLWQFYKMAPVNEHDIHPRNRS